MTTLFRNGIVITQNQSRDVFRGNVLVNGDIIEYAGKREDHADEVIDCTGKIIMPGLINTHTHVAMSHLKGKLDDIPLSSFLEKTFRLDGNRSDQGLYRSSVIGITEMLNSGVTSFVDLYYGEDIIGRAAEDAGMRAFLSWVTLDQDKTTQSGNTLSNAEAFIRSHRDHGLITPSVGIQGIYVAGDDIFLGSKELSEKYGTIVHLHLAETREEVYNYAKQNGGERPVEHLYKIGFLNPSVLAAHCVWLNANEIGQLSRNDVKVSWNPVSNSKLAVGGIAPVPEMIEKGVHLSIGSDSSGSNNSLDVLQSMKFGALLIKNQRWDPSLVKAGQILDMSTIEAAKSLGRNDIGSIGAGMKADLVTLDLMNPRIFPTDIQNAVSSVVYSADSSCVMDVMVNGVFRKRDGRMLSSPHLEWSAESLV